MRSLHLECQGLLDLEHLLAKANRRTFTGCGHERYAVRRDVRPSIGRLNVQRKLVDAVTEAFVEALVDLKGLQSSLFTGVKERDQRIYTLVLESAVLVGMMHSDLRRASLLAERDPHLMHGILVVTFAELSTSLSSLFARGEQLSDWSSTTEAMADAGIGASYQMTQDFIAALRAH
ncbi:MAG: hypothetical protein JWQ41_1774 [Variovorax sp.]|nr:hypothetical protein [Variovorax sp.]